MPIISNGKAATASRRSLLATVGLATIGSLSGCLDAVTGESRVTETTSATYAIDHADALSLLATNGSIVVEGGHRDEVELTVKQSAPTKSDLEAVSTSVRLVGGTLRIITTTDETTDSTGAADLRVRIPTSFPVSRVDAPNGAVTVRNVAARDVLGARTSIGDITVTNLDGTFTGLTGGGPVTIDDTNGSVEVTSSTGDVDVRHASGTVTVESGDGDVSVVETATDVDLETAFGDIAVESIGGDAILATDGGEVSASGVDGRIVRRPASTY